MTAKLLHLDLLRLEHQDLELFCNRGTVRRASAECEAGAPKVVSFKESADFLKVDWEDSASCFLPAGKSLNAATCTCNAVGVCRHLIRTVFYYQSLQSRDVVDGAAPVLDLNDSPDVAPGIAPEAPPENSVKTAALISEHWWPGGFDDEALSAHFKTAMLKKASFMLSQGQVVRLSNGRRPFARFISLSHTVRFIVANNLHFIVCDCRDQPPCLHAAMAVLAFRMIEPTAPATTIETDQAGTQEPIAWISEKHLEAALDSLFSSGFSSIGGKDDALRKLQQLILAANKSGSYFIVELIEELLEAREQQLAGDAIFLPERLASTFAELLCRLDAAAQRAESRRIPRDLILGGKWSAPSFVKTANLTALGSVASASRLGSELRAYAIDRHNGEIISIVKRSAHTSGESLPAFDELAKRLTVASVSFGVLAASNLIVRSGKMTASRELKLAGGKIGISPQDNNWNQLGASVCYDDVDELQNSLANEFPPYLVQRSASLSFRVLKIASSESVSFSYDSQTIQVILNDPLGGKAMLRLPYRSRAARGFERTLSALLNQQLKLQYVAGLWSQHGKYLIVRPASLVFEFGNERLMLQPDIDSVTGVAEEKFWQGAAASDNQLDKLDKLVDFSGTSSVLDAQDLPVQETLRALGNLMVRGILRAGAIDLRQLAMLQQQCEAAQSRLLAPAIAEFIDANARLDSQQGDPATLKRVVFDKFKRLAVVGFLLEQERQ